MTERQLSRPAGPDVDAALPDPAVPEAAVPDLAVPDLATPGGAVLDHVLDRAAVDIAAPDLAAPPPAPASGSRIRGRGWRTRVHLVIRDGVRTFFVRPVRSNVVRAHGGGVTAVSSVTVGILAFAVAAAGVILGPSLARINAAGGHAGADVTSSVGDPVVVPAYFVPALYALLTVGCALALFGAVLARPTTAAAALIFVLLAAGIPAGVAFELGSGIGPRLALIVLICAVAAVLLMRRRRPALPVVQLVTALGAAGAIVPAYVTATRAVHAVQGAAGGFMYTLAGTIVHQADLLIQPIVFFAGVAVIGFGITVAAYVRRSAVLLSRGSVLPLLIAVLGLLAVRAVLTAREVSRRVGSVGLGPAAAAFAITAAAVLAAVAWWQWAANGSRKPQSGSARGQIAVVAVFLGPTLALGVLASAGSIVAAVVQSPGSIGAMASASRWLQTSGSITASRWVTDAAFVGWALLRARRAPGALPGWVGLVGGLDLARLVCSWLAPTWSALTLTDMNQVVVAAVAVGTLGQAVRRRTPTTDRTATTGTLLLIVALAAQGSFISNPFAPILGFTGIGFIVFGVVWGFLTSGGHASARGLPGLGRSLIMLGYAVVPIALLAWKQAGSAGFLTAAVAASTGASGQAYLGDPLLLAVIACWLPVALGLRAGRRGAPVPVPAGEQAAAATVSQGGAAEAQRT